MSSALSLLVLGNVYFLGPSTNTLPTINGTLSPNIHQVRNQTQPLLPVRRSDYTYTLGIGGHKIHSEKVTWNTARKTCEEEGAYLAIINSVAESNLLKDLFENIQPRVDSYLHMGFHDLFQEGEYVTIHNEPLANTGFTEWHAGEPNNDSNKEHCGSIYKDGKLNDIQCGQHHGFVCELPYVAEPENSIVPH